MVQQKIKTSYLNLLIVLILIAGIECEGYNFIKNGDFSENLCNNFQGFTNQTIKGCQGKNVADSWSGKFEQIKVIQDYIEKQKNYKIDYSFSGLINHTYYDSDIVIFKSPLNSNMNYYNFTAPSQGTQFIASYNHEYQACKDPTQNNVYNNYPQFLQSNNFFYDYKFRGIDSRLPCNNILPESQPSFLTQKINLLTNGFYKLGLDFKRQALNLNGQTYSFAVGLVSSINGSISFNQTLSQFLQFQQTLQVNSLLQIDQFKIKIIYMNFQHTKDQPLEVSFQITQIMQNVKFFIIPLKKTLGIGAGFTNIRLELQSCQSQYIISQIQRFNEYGGYGYTTEIVEACIHPQNQRRIQQCSSQYGIQFNYETNQFQCKCRLKQLFNVNIWIGNQQYETCQSKWIAKCSSLHQMEHQNIICQQCHLPYELRPVWHQKQLKQQCMMDQIVMKNSFCNIYIRNDISQLSSSINHLCFSCYDEYVLKNVYNKQTNAIQRQCVQQKNITHISNCKVYQFKEQNNGYACRQCLSGYRAKDVVQGQLIDSKCVSNAYILQSPYCELYFKQERPIQTTSPICSKCKSGYVSKPIFTISIYLTDCIPETTANQFQNCEVYERQGDQGQYWFNCSACLSGFQLQKVDIGIGKVRSITIKCIQSELKCDVYQLQDGKYKCHSCKSDSKLRPIIMLGSAQKQCVLNNVISDDCQYYQRFGSTHICQICQKGKQLYRVTRNRTQSDNYECIDYEKTYHLKNCAIIRPLASNLSKFQCSTCNTNYHGALVQKFKEGIQYQLCISITTFSKYTNCYNYVPFGYDYQCYSCGSNYILKNVFMPSNSANDSLQYTQKCLPTLIGLQFDNCKILKQQNGTINTCHQCYFQNQLRLMYINQLNKSLRCISVYVINSIPNCLVFGKISSNDTYFCQQCQMDYTYWSVTLKNGSTEYRCVPNKQLTRNVNCYTLEEVSNNKYKCKQCIWEYTQLIVSINEQIINQCVSKSWVILNCQQYNFLNYKYSCSKCTSQYSLYEVYYQSLGKSVQECVNSVNIVPQKNCVTYQNINNVYSCYSCITDWNLKYVCQTPTQQKKYCLSSSGLKSVKNCEVYDIQTFSPNYSCCICSYFYSLREVCRDNVTVKQCLSNSSVASILNCASYSVTQNSTSCCKCSSEYSLATIDGKVFKQCIPNSIISLYPNCQILQIINSVYSCKICSLSYGLNSVCKNSSTPNAQQCVLQTSISTIGNCEAYNYNGTAYGCCLCKLNYSLQNVCKSGATIKECLIQSSLNLVNNKNCLSYTVNSPTNITCCSCISSNTLVKVFRNNVVSLQCISSASIIAFPTCQIFQPSGTSYSCYSCKTGYLQKQVCRTGTTQTKQCVQTSLISSIPNCAAYTPSSTNTSYTCCACTNSSYVKKNVCLNGVITKIGQQCVLSSTISTLTNCLTFNVTAAVPSCCTCVTNFILVNFFRTKVLPQCINKTLISAITNCATYNVTNTTYGCYGCINTNYVSKPVYRSATLLRNQCLLKKALLVDCAIHSFNSTNVLICYKCVNGTLAAKC